MHFFVNDDQHYKLGVNRSGSMAYHFLSSPLCLSCLYPVSRTPPPLLLDSYEVVIACEMRGVLDR